MNKQYVLVTLEKRAETTDTIIICTTPSLDIAETLLKEVEETGYQTYLEEYTRWGLEDAEEKARKSAKSFASFYKIIPVPELRNSASEIHEIGR